ncbi:MAG: protein kinase [Acidobacteriota bacterium]
MIGRTVSQYSIEEELGSGGMGVVYRATDLQLGRTVALKFLPRDLQRQDRARDQLLLEAQRASALDHPNICTIFQVHETAEGQLFLAMAYYPGMTLTRYLRRAAGPLPVAEALDLAAQTATGLAAAHELGIVHCDVKPGNLMLSRGQVKILDFGIARLVGSGSERPLAVGTVPYMSPEQLRREPLDARTDVWSLGVVLYQMVSGERPFHGEDHDVVRRSILDREPEPIVQHEPAQNMRLNQILRWALAKNPDDRYRNAAELLADLEASEDERPLGPALVDSARGVTPGSGDTTEPLVASVPTQRATRHHDRPEPALLGRRTMTTPSIVVLPLRDLSAEKDQEHLCFGIAEELITRLIAIDGLRVATRTPIQDQDVDAGELGRRLDVSHVLEGSVRKAGQRLRITARLVSAAHGTVLWSAKYDREIESLFDIQDELAERITDALEAPLRDLPAMRRPGDSTTGNFEAYNHYLKGRYCWNRRTEDELRAAIYHFEMAINEEPGYAPAHAGLADSYTMLGIYGTAPPGEVMPRAKTAAQEALRLDDTLAEVYTSRGCVRAAYEWDFTGAGADFRRAIELDPRYATAYQWYAMNSLLPKRNFELALDHLGRAADLDPLSLPISTSLGLFFYYVDQPERAVLELRRVLESDESFVLARLFLALSLCRLGKLPDALDAALLAAGGIPRPFTTTVLGIVHAQFGHRERAWKLLETLMEDSQGRYVPPTLIAQLYTALDEHDLALGALDRALRLRTADLIWIGIDPVYEPLQRNPRFRAILGEIGLERRI